MKRGLVIAAAALLALPASGLNAQVTVTDDAGKPLEHAPETAQAGSFAVSQLTTTNPDKFVEDWNVPTPGVSLDTQNTALREQRVVSFLIFTGCKTDAKGNCNVRVDWELISPDGKSNAALKDAMVWEGAPLKPGLFMLGDGAMAFRIRDDQPLGIYRMRATTRDLNSGASLVTVSQIEFVESPAKPVS